ncbi:MAG: DinB family protein [Trebonia sp.]
MDTPPRLTPLFEQFDWACLRLLNRITGPEVDSGNGTPVATSMMTDAEYLWAPVPGCWSVRRRADPPGARATWRVGAGEWVRDGYRDAEPYPPPFTTIAWRLSHLTEMLAIRADHTTGGRSMTKETFLVSGDAATAVAELDSAVEAWRAVLIQCDDVALDTVGYSAYPYGSDAKDMFIDVIWWVNQEILHHGAEIALLRDLYRDLAKDH